MQDIKLYIAFDGDKIGRKVGQASMADHPDELRRISQAIENGNNIWKAWALATGGSIVSLGGDEGRLEVPASKLEDLPRLRKEYMMAVQSSVSVGVGQKLSEAEKALVVAKIRGGDQIVLYTKDVDREIEEKLQQKPTSEVDKLAQAYTTKGEVGEATLKKAEAEPMVAPQSATPEPWTPEGLHPELHPIAYLESNYGRNLDHVQSHKGVMWTPQGALGLKPVTAQQEFIHNPEIRKLYPHANDSDPVLVRMMNHNHDFYNRLSSAVWTRFKSALGNHAHRTAYAWRWGFNKARQERESTILADPYVNKFMAMNKAVKEELNMQHKLDFLPSHQLLRKAFAPTDGSIVESPDGQSMSPAAGGGLSPPQQGAPPPEESSSGFNAAPEHSEGEAATNYFAENAPGSPEKTHSKADIERMMHDMANMQHGDDNKQQLQADQEQKKADTKEDMKSEIVKVLQQFKTQAPVIEQLKEQAPELYQSLMQVMQAFVALAQEVVGGQDASQQEETNQDAEGAESGEPAKDASSSPESESATEEETKKHEKLVELQGKLSDITALMKAGPPTSNLLLNLLPPDGKGGQPAGKRVHRHDHKQPRYKMVDKDDINQQTGRPTHYTSLEQLPIPPGPELESPEMPPYPAGMPDVTHPLTTLHQGLGSIVHEVTHIGNETVEQQWKSGRKRPTQGACGGVIKQPKNKNDWAEDVAGGMTTKPSEYYRMQGIINCPKCRLIMAKRAKSGASAPAPVPAAPAAPPAPEPKPTGFNAQGTVPENTSIVWKSEDTPCKSCKGTGKKKQGYDKRDDTVKEVPCKACNGTGSSKAASQEETKKYEKLLILKERLAKIARLVDQEGIHPYTGRTTRYTTLQEQPEPQAPAPTPAPKPYDGPECACGRYGFNTTGAGPNPKLEGVDNDGVHTPERCLGRKLNVLKNTPKQDPYASGPNANVRKAALPPTHHHVILPVGSQMAPEGKIKVQHKEDGVTGKKTNPGKTGWIQARAGQVLSNDGHPISSRNPGGR